MRKIMYSYFCSTLLLFLLLTPTNAQDDKQLLAELVAAEEEAINALVLYPEETRVAILEATLYPEVLIKIESIQSQTRAGFQDLLDRYPQETQEMIWDLTRYPDLIARLVEASQDNSRDREAIIADYPTVIHTRAKEAYHNYLTELEAIHALNTQASQAFEALLVEYPASTQAALRHLLPLPEVLSILTDNIRLAVLAGALYRRDPDWLLAQVDSLHLEVARQNAQELEAWKASLEEDPKAREELKASAEAFSEEYAYDDDYYDYEQDDLYYQERQRDRVAHDYYFYHYPYWFGYPHWYSYPRWRLYPYWYDWGFYIGPGRNLVVISLPSFYYTHWYFYYPNHHYRWSHLSAHFTRHYRAHPRLGSSITTGISVWQHRNRDVVTREWLQDDGNLSNRFREFGKFEKQRSNYNRSHPKAPLTQRQFIERNSRRYPQMAKKAVRSQAATTTIERQPKAQQPTKPRTRTQPDLTQPRKPKTTVFPPKREKVQQPRTTYPSRIKEGTERHRSLSERSKATRTSKVQPKNPRVPAPKTKTIKPKSTTKTQRVPAKKKNN